MMKDVGNIKAFVGYALDYCQIPITGDANWKLVEWRECYRSKVAFVEINNKFGYSKFVVKFICDEDRSKAVARAEGEYNRLVEARTVFRLHAGLDVPEPFGWVPSHAAIVMKMCEGLSLSRYISRSTWLMRPRIRGIVTERAVRLCAMWLRLFHQMEGNSLSRDNLIEERQAALLARLNQIKTILASANFSKLIDKDIEKYNMFDESNWSEARYGMIHHDFGCHNILVNGGGITVLDLGDARFGCVLDDVMRFVVELEMLSGTSFNGLDKKSYSNIKNYFLEEYFKNSQLRKSDLHLLEFYKKMNCLRLMITINSFKRDAGSRKFFLRCHNEMFDTISRFMFKDMNIGFICVK